MVFTMTEGRERRSRKQYDADGSELIWPGAQNKFLLFAEIVWTGILVTVASLPVVTFPAALAAGTRHLHRYLRAEPTSVSRFFREWRQALPGGLLIGLLAVLAALVLAADIALAVNRVVPGWPVVLLAGVLGSAVLLVTLVHAAVRWNGSGTWRAALGEGFRSLRTDPLGAAFTAAALAVAAGTTWQLAPLLMPGLGGVVFIVLCVYRRGD